MSEFMLEEQRLKRARGNSQSWYERIIPDLTDEQRKALDDALSDKNITARAISVVLGRWGHEVKEHTIGTWRRHRAVR